MSLFDLFFSRRPAPRRAARRLNLESLEGRAVPAPLVGLTTTYQFGDIGAADQTDDSAASAGSQGYFRLPIPAGGRVAGEAGDEGDAGYEITIVSGTREVVTLADGQGEQTQTWGRKIVLGAEETGDPNALLAGSYGRGVYRATDSAPVWEGARMAELLRKTLENADHSGKVAMTDVLFGARPGDQSETKELTGTLVFPAVQKFADGQEGATSTQTPTLRIETENVPNASGGESDLAVEDSGETAARTRHVYSANSGTPIPSP